MPKEDCRINQRLKRLVQRFAQAQLARVFTAWKEEAEFERSVHRLDSLLQLCEDVFGQPAHERSEASLSAVLQLLQHAPLLSAMCPEAQRCIAAHAKLTVLSDLVELPTCQEDHQQLYAVLTGSVTLLHGNAADPQLQLLLQAAQQPQRSEEDEGPQPPVDLLQTQSSNSSTAAELNSSTDMGFLPRSQSSCLGSPASISAASCKQRGVWHQVKEAVSAGQKRELHSSMMGGQQQQPTTASAPVTSRELHSRGLGCCQAGSTDYVRPSASISAPEQQMLAGELLSCLDADALTSSISLGIVGPGQCFCGYKFAEGWTSSATSAGAASPDKNNNEDNSLNSATLPCSCVAAVAEPNRVVGLLVVSRPVYMEATRLNLEAYTSRVVATLCRLPCLRHTPIKELHRLAAHVKEATYEPGQLLLKQGREVPEIHFLISGSVLLTYSPPVNPAAAVAAKLSLTGPPNSHISSNSNNITSMQSSLPQTTAAAIVAAVAAGGARADTGCAFGTKRSSGLADLLRLGQQAVQPAAVVGVRGPGSILGDDAMRERRLAVGVMTATRVLTLKVEPQKFLSCLDPLTLRLFGRLRPQQVPAQQKLIQQALHDTNNKSQQQPEQLHRLAILTDVYQSTQIPLTLRRPGDEQFEQAAERIKARWQSTRSISPTAMAPRNRHSRRPHSPIDCNLSIGTTASTDGLPASRVLDAPRQKVAKVAQNLNREDAAWEACLPRGLTVEKCAGLPQSTSVVQLLEVIRDVDEFRRMQGSLPLPSSDTVSMQLTLNSIVPPAPTAIGTAAARATAANICPPLAGLQFSGAKAALAGAVSPPTASGYLSTEPAALAAAAAAAAASAPGGNVHTELVEACGIAVLQLDVLPGQVVVAGSTIASAVDDVAASWAAIAHDEGLQLIRWEARQWMLLAQLEPGTSKRAGLEGLADALLACAARMIGVLSRIEGLPALSLAAGVASGSCFVQYEAGNFICSVSGNAYEAAVKLCQAAASLEPTAAAEFAHSSSAGSRIALLLSDGAACCLHSNFCLQPCNGGYLLTAIRAALPAGPGSKSGAALGFSAANSRQTLGPGRHTILGTGLSLNPVTPKTPGQGFARRVTGKAQQRRQMRRKFEALQDLLAGPGDVLPPPPEHMLTQPPPRSTNAGGTAGSSGDSVKVLGSGRGILVSGLSESESPSSGSAVRPARGLRPNLKIALVTDGSLMDADPVTPGIEVKTPNAAPCLQGYQPSGALTPTLIMDSPWWTVGSGKQGTGARGIFTRPAARASMIATATAGTVSDSAGPATAGQLPTAEGSNKSNISTPGSTGSSRSSFRLRQQVWQEVAEMRGREGATPRGSAGSPCSISGSGSSSCNGSRATPARKSPCVRGTTPLSLDLQQLQGRAAAGEASASPQSSSFKATSGSLEAGRTAGARSPLKVTFQSPRGSHGPGKLSPRLAQAANQHHPAAAAVRSKQQQQQQLVEAEASLQSVNSMSLFPDPFGDNDTAAGFKRAAASFNHNSTSGNAGLHISTRHTSSPGASAFQAVEAARLQQQRQQALVASACKALGSFAAAEGYVAGLPDNLLAVNLSAAGLNRLPALAHLTQPESLSASFNRLRHFPKLAPADEVAVAAAVAAAADHSSCGSNNTNLGAGSHQLHASASSAAAMAEVLSAELASKVLSALPATLTRLGLSYNDLELVPSELPAALPQLTELDLSHNKLKELPCTFGALPCLKLLLVGHNQLASLPHSITRLLLLHTLDLSYNSVAELPSGLNQLQSLDTLRMQHNKLEQLPANLAALTGLRNLSLGYNKLSQLPEGVLLQFNVLTSLDLAGNGLTGVVLEAAVRTVQQTSTTDGVRSTPVPQDPGAAAAADRPRSRPVSPLLVAPTVTGPLPALRILDISHNKLQLLPSWLPAGLQRLLAAGNRIQQVPGDQLAHLSSGLVELDLQGNILHDLPAQLKLLANLQILALAGNPGLDPGVAERGAGLKWAYSWLAGQKSAAISAVSRGAHGMRQQQAITQQQQQPFAEVLPSLPGIRQTIIVESGRGGLLSVP